MDFLPVDAESLREPDQMGRGVQRDLQARVHPYGFQHGSHRAFSIGARNVNVFLAEVRVPESLEQIEVLDRPNLMPYFWSPKR